MLKRKGTAELIERPESGEHTIGVHINWKSRDGDLSDSRENKEEFVHLIKAAGIEIDELITTTRQKPDPKFFIGKGKTEAIRERISDKQPALVIFNHDLSPLQERNLERVLKSRVLDRTGLILDIFAQRARSHEGQLQVELAQLQHLATRLVRGWTHLERQRGGIGLRGPGETQLEVDRRLIETRIKAIKKQLAQVEKQRHQNRRARDRAAIPAVSLVGYTNAGKSTLFNQITQAHVGTADQLFATLDPTVRRIELPMVGVVTLSDTVGFIRHLPHELIEAFKATLEETRLANLLLHVVDIANSEHDAQMRQVDAVLDQIDADQTHQLVVCNKIDRLNAPCTPRIERDSQGKPKRVWLSAQTGEGVELLRQALQECLVEPLVHCCIRLSPKEGQLRARLHALDCVLSEAILPDGDMCLEIKLQWSDYYKLLGQPLSGYNDS